MQYVEMKKGVGEGCAKNEIQRMRRRGKEERRFYRLQKQGLETEEVLGLWLFSFLLSLSPLHPKRSLLGLPVYFLHHIFFLVPSVLVAIFF